MILWLASRYDFIFNARYQRECHAHLQYQLGTLYYQLGLELLHKAMCSLELMPEGDRRELLAVCARRSTRHTMMAKFISLYAWDIENEIAQMDKAGGERRLPASAWGFCGLYMRLYLQREPRYRREPKKPPSCHLERTTPTLRPTVERYCRDANYRQYQVNRVVREAAQHNCADVLGTFCASVMQQHEWRRLRPVVWTTLVDMCASRLRSFPMVDDEVMKFVQIPDGCPRKKMEVMGLSSRLHLGYERRIVARQREACTVLQRMGKLSLAEAKETEWRKTKP